MALEGARLASQAIVRDGAGSNSNSGVTLEQLYNELKANNDGNKYLDYDAEKEDKKNEDNTTRQANWWERSLASLYNTGSGILNSLNNGDGENNAIANMKQGWQKGDIGQMAGGFGEMMTTLPAQMLGGGMQGVANLHEGITGDNIVDSNIEETGTIKNQKLTTAERAGAIGSGLINTLGIGVGGSGKMIGGTAKGLAAMAGKELPTFDLFAKAGANGAVQFAKNTAEEGLEEGLDSLFQDARNDTFDEGSLGRAGEASLFGAIGGAGMHGIGVAAEGTGKAIGKHVTKKYNNQAATNPNTAQNPVPVNTTPTGENFWQVKKTDNVSDQVDSVVAERITELNESRNKTSGTTITISATDPNIGINESSYSIGALRNHFIEGPDENGVDEVDRFLANAVCPNNDRSILPTKDFITNALVNNDFDALATKLNECIAQGVVWKAGNWRNPKTHHGSHVKVKIHEFLPGYTMRMNPMAVPMFGADIDGDTFGFSGDRDIVDNSLPLTRYFMENRRLPNAEGLPGRDGTTGPDEDYIGLDLTRNSLNDLTTSIRNAWDSFNAGNQNRWLDGNDINRWLNKFRDEVFAGDGNGDFTAFCRWMQELVEEVSTHQDLDGRNIDGDTLISMIVTNMQLTTGWRLSFDKVVGKYYDQQADQIFYELEQVKTPGTENTGKLSDNIASYAQLKELLGQVYQVITLRENPSLRSNQWAGWLAGKSEDLGLTLEEIGGREDAVLTFLAVQMRIIDVGEHPITQVNGMFNQLAMQALFKDSTTYNRKAVVPQNVSFDQFLEDWIAAYNPVVKLFNDSLEKLGYKDVVYNIDEINKNPLNKKEPATAMRAFIDVFGELNACDVFGLPSSHPAAGYTVNEVIEMAATNIGGSMLDVAGTFNPAAAEVMKRAIEDYHGRSDAKSSSIEKIVDGLTDIMNTSTLYDRDANGVIETTDRNIALLQPIYAAIRDFVGVDVCLYNGWVNAESMFKGEYGRFLLGGNQDQMLHALASAIMRYKWRTYIHFKGNDQASFTDEIRARIAAQRMLGISALDDWIVDRIGRGDDSPLRFIIDVNSCTFAELKDDFGKLMKSHDGKSRSAGFADNIFRTATAEMADGQLSKQLRTAKSRIVTARKRQIVAERNALQIVRDNVIKGQVYTGHDVANALIAAAKEELAIPSIELKACAAYDDAMLMKPHLDKGVSPESSTLNYAQNSLLETGYAPMSFLEKLTGTAMGSLNMSQAIKMRRDLLRAITDPDYSFRVEFPERDGYAVIDQRRIFESLDDVQLQTVVNGTPTWNQFDALFEKYPDITTLFAPVTFQPMIGAEGQVTMVTTKSFNDFVNEKVHETKSNSATRNREMQVVKAAVMNDVGISRAIIANIAARSDDYDAVLDSPRKFMEEYKKSVDIISDFLLKAASSKLSGEGVRDIYQTYELTPIVKMFDDFMSSVTEVETALKRAENTIMGDLTDGYLAGFQQELAGMLCAGRVAAQHGLSMPVPTGPNQTSAAHVQEMADSLGTAFSIIDAIIQDAGDVTARINIEDSAVARALIAANEQAHQANPNSAQLVDNQTLISELVAEMGRGDAVNQDPVVKDLITIHDLQNLSAAELAAKANAIFDRPGFNIATEKDTVRARDIQEILDEQDPGVRERSLKRFQHRYNAKLLSYYLKDINAFINKNTNTRAYSAEMEAVLSIENLVCKLRSTNWQQQHGMDFAFESDTFRNTSKYEEQNFPQFDFSKMGAIAQADQAVSSAEGAGNTVNAGIEGGQYKKNLVLGAIERNRETGITEEVSIGDILNSFNDDTQFMSRYYGCWYVSPFNNDPNNQDAFLTPGKLRALEQRIDQYNAKHPKAQIPKTITVYPLDLNANGLGLNAVSAANSIRRADDQNRRSEAWHPLTALLADLGYDGSEPRVFKRKKVIGRYDEVIRGLMETELGRRNIYGGRPFDFAQVRRAFIQYRNEVAQYYYSEFQAEKIDESFGKYDALLLTQFTTPFCVMTDANGNTFNLNAAVMLNENTFNDFVQQNNITSPIASIVPMPMSVSQVTARAEQAISEAQEQAHGPLSGTELDTIVNRALTDFNDYQEIPYGVDLVLTSVQGLAHVTPFDIQVGVSPLTSGRLLTRTTGYEHGSNQTVDLLDQSGLPERVRELIKEGSKHFLKTGSETSGVLVTSANYDKERVKNDGRTPLEDVGEFDPGTFLNGIVGERAVNLMGMQRPARVLTGTNLNDASYMEDEFERCRRTGEIMLVAASDKPNLTKIPEQCVDWGGTFDTAIGDCIVIDPKLNDTNNYYEGSESKRISTKVEDYEIFVGDWGEFTGSDSESCRYRNAKHYTQFFEGQYELTIDQLFNMQALGNSSEGYSIEAVSLTELQDIRDLWLAHNGQQEASPFFHYPNFDANRTPMQRKQFIDAAVEKYFEDYFGTNPGMVQEGTFKTRDMHNGDCIGFVKVMSGGMPSYAPVIVGVGGCPVDLSLCTLDRLSTTNSKLSFRVEGELNPYADGGIDAIKIIFGTDAYKSMMPLIDENLQQYAPQLGIDINYKRYDKNGNFVENDVVTLAGLYNQKTRAGRSVERGISILEHNLANGAMLHEYSYFLRRKPDGGYDLDVEKFRDMGLLNEMFTEQTLYDLFIGNPRAWRMVANGSIRLHSDQRIAANMQKVAYSMLIEQHLDPSMVFGNIINHGLRENSGKYQVRRIDMDWHMITGKFSRTDDYLGFWNALAGICPPNVTEGQNDNQATWMFDYNGNLKVKQFDKQTGEQFYGYRPCEIRVKMAKHIATNLGLPSGSVSFGDQQFVNAAVERGLPDSNDARARFGRIVSQQARRADSYLPGSSWYNERYSDNQRLESEIDNQVANAASWYQSLDEIVEANNAWRPSKYQLQRDNEVEVNGQQTWDSKNLLSVVYTDGFVSRAKKGGGEKLATMTDASDQSRKYQESVERVWQALGCTGPTQLGIVHILVKAMTGYGTNLGVGTNKIPLNEFVSACDRIVDAVDPASPNPTTQYFIEGGWRGDRLSIPLLPKPWMDWLWTQCPNIQQKFNGSQAEFNNAAIQQMQRSLEELDSLLDAGKKKSVAQHNALLKLIEFSYRSHGLGRASGIIDGRMSISEMVKQENKFFDRYCRYEPSMKQVWDRDGEYTRQVLKDFKAVTDARKTVVTHNDGQLGGQVKHSIFKNMNGKKVSDGLIKSAQVCSLANLVLWPASVATRAKNATVTDVCMHLNVGLGKLTGFNTMLGSEWNIDQSVLREACKTKELHFVHNALRILKFNADDTMILSQVQSTEQLMKFLEDKAKQQNLLDKIQDAVYRFAGAQGVFDSTVIREQINYFAQRLPPDSVWLQVNPETGNTYLNDRIAADPAGAYIDMFSAKGDNPHYMLGLQARNFAARLDNAQETAKGLLLEEIFKRVPATEFIMKLGICKFPHYAMNLSDFVLNFIAPVSSINYVFTEWVSKKTLFGVNMEQLHVERTQIYPDLRSALVHDAVRMSFSMLGMLFSCLPGLFEPPEEDKKKGNLSEWTFFGMRLTEAWWMTEIAGPAFALGATMKSAMMGDFRPDILSNWLSAQLLNHPTASIGQVVSDLLGGENPAEEWLESYERYADSKGGTPTATEAALTGVLTYGLNFASQFVTPAFVKDFYQNNPLAKERSSKKVYKLDKNGNRYEDENGLPETENTDFMDRKFRELSKKNPFAALMLDVMNGGPLNQGTGYFYWEMPMTTYYKEPQIYYMNKFSTYDSVDGKQVPRSTEKLNAEALEILSTLENYDDMDELQKTGFMVPSDMRNYVSQIIWDNYDDIEQNYNAWVQETGMDANVVGNGDFAEGMKIISEVKQAKKDDQSHLYDLYNKLWDDALVNGLEVYNRYNTTYATDENGDIYATGYLRAPFGLTVQAPGNLNDAGNTMGREGNWETPDSNGVSTGDRALVPVATTYTDKPKLEDWGDTSSKKTSYTSKTPTYTKRSGGSSGGGSYSPNIYSRLPSGNMNSARTMNAERLYDANFDYLRPNWETKGSREAYKRSDI